MKNSTAPDLVARTQITFPAATTVPTSRLLCCAATAGDGERKSSNAVQMSLLDRGPAEPEDLLTERCCMTRSTAALATRSRAPSRARFARAAPRQRDENRAPRVTPATTNSVLLMRLFTTS